MSLISNDSDHYNELVARQVEQYKETVIMHDLPPIYDYWTSRHISDKCKAVTGHNDIVAFYADYFRSSLLESGSTFLISIGAGDCSIEINVVKKLISEKAPPFFFICLELSPLLIEKARKKIDEAQLGDIITVAQVDINKWMPKYSFAGVMAHHALHHFLDLEELFKLIRNNLAPKGRFLTCDMIGRNGHMRWPEALVLTRKIWERLPRKYKFNNQLKKYDDYFENWDFSVEGFEGIRAQDILPLLVSTFSFEVFFPYGNLIDPFVDRGFGSNYDPENPLDKAFIDYLQVTNEALISEGILKPTSLVAVMMNDKIDSPRIYKHWNPEFAIRNPKLSPPAYDPEAFLEGIPYTTQQSDNPIIANNVNDYSINTQLKFTIPGNFPKNTVSGLPYLTYGWGNVEDSFTWTIGEAAALILPLTSPVTGDVRLELKFISYPSPLYPQNVIGVSVNGTRVDELKYDNTIPIEPITAVVNIPASLVKGRKSMEIVFELPNRRQPQYEHGTDIRSLGIGLSTATILNR